MGKMLCHAYCYSLYLQRIVAKPHQELTSRGFRPLCRDEYTVDQLVGGHSGQFFMAGRACVREDTVLVGWPHACSLQAPQAGVALVFGLSSVVQHIHHSWSGLKGWLQRADQQGGAEAAVQPLPAEAAARGRPAAGGHLLPLQQRQPPRR